ncbi:ASCH domain-containing protein [Kineosporia babensis]|uniref:ASCH domain-containing protein n=1 Tax=Kineosporia babensis TaxID=499548 RepID=A0A9X1SVX1_9ACTN|nr:ASCH domain-containing protein [Kineosporia babensis]MCD5314141.1 ASCH domain-containing protein [Kineosporia babensis]
MELGSPGEMRAELNGLVLAGTKRATAGLFSDYEEDGEAIEQPGEVMVLVDDDLAEVGRIVITGFEVVPFDQVTDEFARSEGEGFADHAAWAVAHRRFWESYGLVITGETLISCTSFRLANG